jgi:hypothetical protein
MIIDGIYWDKMCISNVHSNPNHANVKYCYVLQLLLLFL